MYSSCTPRGDLTETGSRAIFKELTFLGKSNISEQMASTVAYKNQCHHIDLQYMGLSADVCYGDHVNGSVFDCVTVPGSSLT